MNNTIKRCPLLVFAVSWNRGIRGIFLQQQRFAEAQFKIHTLEQGGALKFLFINVHLQRMNALRDGGKALPKGGVLGAQIRELSLAGLAVCFCAHQCSGGFFNAGVDKAEDIGQHTQDRPGSFGFCNPVAILRLFPGFCCLFFGLSSLGNTKGFARLPHPLTEPF